MLGSSSDTIWVSNFFGAIVVAAIVAFFIYRDRVRRKSLRRREDGMFVWVEWHGGERVSHQDPSQPGGEWSSDGDGGGDGGGD